MNNFTDILLPITCPVCQHTWQMDTPAIPWRALPAFGEVICASCDTLLLIRFEEKDGQLQRSVKAEEQTSPLFQVAGIFEIDEPGWADRHDEYIAETHIHKESER